MALVKLQEFQPVSESQQVDFVVLKYTVFYDLIRLLLLFC